MTKSGTNPNVYHLESKWGCVNLQSTGSQYGLMRLLAMKLLQLLLTGKYCAVGGNIRNKSECIPPWYHNRKASDNQQDIFLQQMGTGPAETIAGAECEGPAGSSKRPIHRDVSKQCQAEAQIAGRPFELNSIGCSA